MRDGIQWVAHVLNADVFYHNCLKNMITFRFCVRMRLLDAVMYIPFL